MLVDLVIPHFRIYSEEIIRHRYADKFMLKAVPRMSIKLRF